jgi:hypothetical protein
MDFQAADTKENSPSSAVVVDGGPRNVFPPATDDGVNWRPEDAAKATVINRWPLKGAQPDLAATPARLHAAIAEIAEVCQRHGVMLACGSDLCFRLAVTGGRTTPEVCGELDGSVWVAQHADATQGTPSGDVAFAAPC